ncbi:hypothetical protein OAA06_01745 [bacterium]|nr:hypothetical protein [bacterium]
MAILDFHNNLPDNHTYSDLILGLDRVMVIDPALRERILKYENIQSICSVDNFSITIPIEKDLMDLKGAIMEISEIAHDTCVPIS